MSEVRLEKIDKYFGQFAAVKDVSLDLRVAVDDLPAWPVRLWENNASSDDCRSGNC